VSRTLSWLTPLWLVALVTGLAWAPGIAGQAPSGQDPAGLTHMSDPAAAVAPEQQALDAAMRLTKTTDRLAALDKIRKDFPQSPLLNAVDTQILSAALQMPDSADAAAEILDRMLARIPAGATADDRFAATVVPVAQLISRKVLLDRAEKLLADTTAPAALSAESRARSRYELGRLYAAKGDPDRAEIEYRAAAPKWAAAVSALVTLYVGRDEKPKAEAFLLDVVKTAPVNLAALTSLTNLYKSEPAKAEAVLKEAVGRDPLLPNALLSLARLEQQRGNDTDALEHFMRAATMFYLRGTDADAMRTLYAKLHGKTDGLDAEINTRFLALPKAMSPARYVPTARRTNRMVVLEMFTGSACPPCVAADLAMDAALVRYPADAVVALAYHQHIPGPDPMVTTEGNARRQYYSVNGVPTLEIDGAMVAGPDGGTFGGGGRDRAPEVFEKYAGIVEAALESASEAAVAVRATIVGDKVTVTADVASLPAGAEDLRLHLVLAERELLFGGENGVRSHSMVVRGVAGEKGRGVPLSGTGQIQKVFDLAAIRADITNSLATELAVRRAAAGSAPQAFAAEDRAMTHIDPAHLVVVAFIQAPNKRILQAARTDVVAAVTPRH
jgi:tetratricopeptide (TPR) repeat protein